ncbi:MAG: hypothetical protein Q7R33_00680, partial [Nitrosarchaeum sp.]|nr:hypothetical protein [Nitrosarchaeum sp.]
MKKFTVIVSFLFFFSHYFSYAQNFLNGDLDGIVTGAGVLPANWQNVPFTDTNCLASSAGWDSPDLTDISGPSASTGILGNPYSGLTFVSGMYGGTFGPFPNNFWQEGIMQNVLGFNINQVYV